ncbi:MAG: hypothetical protein KIT10_01300 [Flavobacteriales bacterium]|nr:hypothetical protein [Flavobacteriales bacterium]
MSAKPTLLVILSFAMVAAVNAQDQSYSDCLMKVGSKWGAPCEKCEYYKEGYKRDFSGTFILEMRNTCREMIEVKMAMQEKGGTWRTFPVKALAANESMEAFACQGTGKYLYWVRRVNDTEIILPSDQEIITEYRGR